MSAVELFDTGPVDPGEVTRFLGLKDASFFEYEYRRFRPEQSVFVQARDSGRLVGTQALVPYPLRIDGKPVISGRSERTMVAPEMRGGGLFSRLMESCATQGAAKQLELIWGTTTARNAFQRNGFVYTDKFYEHALLCIAPVRAVRDVLATRDSRLRIAKAVCAAPSVALRAANALTSASRVAVTPLPRCATDIDDLYDALRGNDALTVLQHEPRFLRWLLDEGARKVARFHAYSGNTLVAYAYVDVTSAGTATLSDFAARDSSSMRALLRSVVLELGARGFTYLYARYNVRNPLLARQRRWLVAAGFVPFYRGGGFVVRPLSFQDFNCLADISRWYITELWFQLYPQSLA